jgi:hypothetical protein
MRYPHPTEPPRCWRNTGSLPRRSERLYCRRGVADATSLASKGFPRAPATPSPGRNARRRTTTTSIPRSLRAGRWPARTATTGPQTLGTCPAVRHAPARRARHPTLAGRAAGPGRAGIQALAPRRRGSQSRPRAPCQAGGRGGQLPRLAGRGAHRDQRAAGETRRDRQGAGRAGGAARDACG